MKILLFHPQTPAGLPRFDLYPVVLQKPGSDVLCEGRELSFLFRCWKRAEKQSCDSETISKSRLSLKLS